MLEGYLAEKFHERRKLYKCCIVLVPTAILRHAFVMW